MSEDIHEHFRNYRGAGIAISATLITLSSALIVWGQKQIPVALQAGAVGQLKICLLQLKGVGDGSN